MKFVLGLFLIALCVLPMHNTVQDVDAHDKHVTFSYIEERWNCTERTSACIAPWSYYLLVGRGSTPHDEDHPWWKWWAHDVEWETHITATNNHYYVCTPCRESGGTKIDTEEAIYYADVGWALQLLRVGS